MTDERLSGLFAEGTAPESDPAFALGVTTKIGRERRRLRFLAMAPRAAMTLALAGAALAAARLIEPLLAQLVEDAPRFMGAPAPMVLAVLIVGLALGARRYILARGAGPGVLEPFE